MLCKNKVPYPSGAVAESARQKYISEHKTDKRNARLVCYHCRVCGLWHLGHSRRKPQPAAAAPKKVKGPTPGELRRAAKRAAEKAAKQALFADYQDTLRICKILADRQFALYAALGIKPRTTTGEAQ
jgi:hypothetical protein